MRRSRSRSRSRSRKSNKSRSRKRTASREPKCPSGRIYRQGYTRRRGNSRVTVPGNCIRATSQSRQKRSVLDRKYLAQRAKMYKTARRKFSKQTPKRCPQGRVLREGFYRQPTRRRSFKRSTGTQVSASTVAGAWVPPTCVPSINRQKKKRLFVLERNVLGKYGYHNVKNLTTGERHEALDKALDDGIEPLPLLRRVNALYVLNKNQDPTLAQKFKQDVNYIRTTQEYQNRPTARPVSRSSRRSSRQGSRRRSSRSRRTSRRTSSRSRRSRRGSSRSRRRLSRSRRASSRSRRRSRSVNY